MDDPKTPKEPLVPDSIKKAQEYYDKQTWEEPNGFIEVEVPAKIIPLSPLAAKLLNKES